MLKCNDKPPFQLTFTCSKTSIKVREKGLKHDQS